MAKKNFTIIFKGGAQIVVRARGKRMACAQACVRMRRPPSDIDFYNKGGPRATLEARQYRAW